MSGSGGSARGVAGFRRARNVRVVEADGATPILDAGDIQRSPFDQLLPFNGGIDRETRSDSGSETIEPCR